MAQAIGRRSARWPSLLAGLALFSQAIPATPPPALWQTSSVDELRPIDDDIARHAGTPGYFDGLEISTARFAENGFSWQLVRFRNPARPDGPLWVVPHDDEDGAFDAMIAALRQYGGVGIAVNTSGAQRMQRGHGACGVRTAIVSACDPNRNFSAGSPVYTAAFLDQLPAGQPVIALHTNRPGFAGDSHGGHGDITVVDMTAWHRGTIAPRSWALLAVSPAPAMANYDTFGLSPFLAKSRRPSAADTQCGVALAQAGISYWHERVVRSDGSFSNYLALNRPDIAYFNAESRAETDPAIAAARHGMIIAAYLGHCLADPQSIARAGDHPPAAHPAKSVPATKPGGMK